MHISCKCWCGRADVDLADGAGLRGAQGRGRVGNVFQEYNFALGVDCREVGRRTGPRINQGATHAFRRGRAREGMRDAVGPLAADLDLDASSARQADIGVVQDELGAPAVPVEAGLQVAEAFTLLRGPRQLDPPGELLKMAHHRGCIDGRAKRRDGRLGYHARPLPKAARGARTSGTGCPARSFLRNLPDRLITPAPIASNASATRMALTPPRSRASDKSHR